MTSYRVWGAALVALAGCTDSTNPGDPGPGSRTITARDVLTFRGADGGSHAIATDLDRAVVQALVQGEGGTWRVFPGEGTAAGTIEIASVPAGDAIVRVDYDDPSPEPRVRNEYFFVHGDDDVELDLGTWRAGRADAKFAATAPTELRLDMTGLAPYQPASDLIVFYEPNVGFVNVFNQDIPDAISGIPAQDATASQLHIDWVTAVLGPLAEAARGDRSYLMQFRFRELAGVLVGAPVRAAALPMFTQIDGQPTTVAADLATPSPLRVRLAMDRDAFDALRTAINPMTGAASGRGFAISSTPSVVTDEFSLGSLPAELVVLDENALSGTGRFDLGDLDVASPFPTSSTFGRFVSAYPVPVLRDDGVLAQARAEIGVMTSALPTETAPATPIISPVRGITIEGRDAFSSPTGVGLAPTISWQAPELGTPAEYEVRVLAPGGADPTYDFVWYPSAIFHVPGNVTSLRLPTETLDTGLPYALAIRAIAQPLSLDTSPRRLALPYGWADAITPEFKP